MPCSTQGHRPRTVRERVRLDVWTGDRTKRRSDTPNRPPAHHPDGAVFAIHVSPRRLYPSEMSATRPAPAGGFAAVWRRARLATSGSSCEACGHAAGAHRPQ